MLRKVLTDINSYATMMLRNATKGGGMMRELLELKGKIRENKTSYRELAKKIGMSTNTLSNKINGYSAFDIVEASQIADVLGIPPDKIAYFFA